jgi:hypothetical protein
MPSIETSYSWVRLLVLITLSTLGCVGLWSLAVALPAVHADFDVQRAGASVPYAFIMIGFMIGGITVGRLADRFGILPPFGGGTILMCLGYILTASAPTPLAFALVSGLTIGLRSAASFAPLVLGHYRQLSFRCGLSACHRPLGSRPPRSGLERSDFVRRKPSAAHCDQRTLPAERDTGAANRAATKEWPLSDRVPRNEPHVGHPVFQASQN